jgi:hypothetical protein
MLSRVSVFMSSIVPWAIGSNDRDALRSSSKHAELSTGICRSDAFTDTREYRVRNSIQISILKYLKFEIRSADGLAVCRKPPRNTRTETHQ